MPKGVQNDDGTFERKHIDEIVDDLVTKLRQEAGQDLELRQNSPLKQIIDTLALELAEQWEAAEDAYYSSYYQDAFGVQLDRLLAVAGVSRIPRRSATGEVVFSTDSANNSDVVIPSGTEVTTPDTQNTPAIPFKTTERATLTAGTTSVTVPIKGMAPYETDVDEDWLGGETNVAANTISRITTPISGVDSVTNPDPTGDTSLGFVEGRDRESDAEFKLRYENSLSQSGDATLDAIRSEIFNRDESIVNVSMEENVKTTDNTASGGLPPKSFRATVLGGSQQDIGQAILDSRPAGIESYGDISVTATTDDGEDHTEYFQRATQVDIYVDITITTMDSYPSDGVQQITDNIIRYVGGETSNTLDYPGTEIGEDVIYDQVFAQIMNIGGVREVDFTLGTSDNPTGTSNISVSDTEVARTDSAWIDITVN